MKFLKGVKFEHLFSIMTLGILTIALFVFKEIEEIRTTVITSLVGTLSAVTAFFFTKHQVKKEKEE